MSQKLTSGSRHTSHLLVLLKVGQHCVFKVGMGIFHVKNGFLDSLEELGHLVTLGPVPARLGGRGPRWAFQAGWAPPCALPPGPSGYVGGPPAVEPRWSFSLGGLLCWGPWVPAFRPQLPAALVTSVECPGVDSRALSSPQARRLPTAPFLLSEHLQVRSGGRAHWVPRFHLTGLK